MMYKHNCNGWDVTTPSYALGFDAMFIATKVFSWGSIYITNIFNLETTSFDLQVDVDGIEGKHSFKILVHTTELCKFMTSLEESVVRNIIDVNMQHKAVGCCSVH